MARVFTTTCLTALVAVACANSAPRQRQQPLPTSAAGGGAPVDQQASASARNHDKPDRAGSSDTRNSTNGTRVTSNGAPGSSSAPGSNHQHTGNGHTGPRLCPVDMVAVQGTYCTRLERKCLRRRKHRQCAEYEAESRCKGSEVAMRFCMDRYEWPNQEGQLPKVMNTWKDAKKSCAEVGKRLCTEDEWTLACEGPERLGFPYGNVRDSSACPFDKPSPRVNERRLYYSATQAAELARLDQRDPSGSYARCVSPYGVRDMTGSVDEWVFYPPGKPYRSSLKGGNWGEYRNACRPVTRGHGENWRYYQTGFRCCQAIADKPSSP